MHRHSFSVSHHLILLTLVVTSAAACIGAPTGGTDPNPDRPGADTGRMAADEGRPDIGTRDTGTRDTGTRDTGAPDACGDNCPAACGNGDCELGEDETTCPDDCDPGCGNGTCDADENNIVCPVDCPVMCGNGACEPPENANDCPDDCVATCPNAACESGEDNTNCPDDCAASCRNGVCEADENNANCPDDCTAMCGNNVCETSEHANNCDADCDPRCGNAACEAGESSQNCAADCMVACGNGLCEMGENNANCAADCPPNTIVTSAPAAANDDAEENVASGSVNVTSSDLEMTMESVVQKVGIRFALDVGPSETIAAAWVQFTVDETGSDPTDLVVSAEATDDAAAFSTTSGNITGRAATTANVSWAPPAWTTVGDAGPDQRTSDLTAIIQEIVNRPGWVRGNHVAILISGTGKRVAHSYDGDPGSAPVLHVEYGGPRPGCGDGMCAAGENNNNCSFDCAPMCGNGACEATENPANCLMDCPPVCGNAVCENGESTATCPQDCPAVCPNGTCDPGEDCITCAQDCGMCSINCGDNICGMADEHCETCPGDCGVCAGTPPTVTRGPYLQTPTTTSVVVKWRTAAATDSVVAYGPSPNNLTEAVVVQGSTMRHEVMIDGLATNTRYYYAVGASGTPLVGGGADYFFDTLPTPGIATSTRIWVIGDSGAAGSDQRAVTDAYLSYAAGAEADVWLMLGDNAYSDGTDDEYQAAVFDPGAYQDVLRRQAVWPTIGNHERVSVNGNGSPYLEIFTLPTQGEAGGLASGTERYYSFDYGDIHFVCLDSDTNNDSAAAMTWLENDLAANDKTWLIAFWHHPPYTNGSHNSDDEGTLADMRENFVPILEAYGVDMVFTGHSHSYERSLWLYGHYGDSSQVAAQPGVVLDSGDGDPASDGPYTKLAGANCPDISGLPFADPLQSGANCGTVYSVVGSSAKTSASDFPTRYNGGPLMPMMHTFQEKLGSVVIDIDQNRADIVFLNSGDDGSGTANYTITDRYTVMK